MAKEKFKKITYEQSGLLWHTFPELCKSCGICIEKCPVKCLSYDGENGTYLGMPAVRCHIEKCIACRTCESSCPDCAILVEGKRIG